MAAKSIEECQKECGQVWTAKIEGVGDFIFRKPKPIEWREYDGARVPFTAALTTGNITKELSIEFLKACEDLCARVVVSHTAEDLQRIDEEFLGIYRDIASEIAATVDALRSKSGKESAPRGPTPSPAKSPNE